MADKDLQHVQHIRGSEAASDAYTGLEGEVTINRTSQSVRVHDGVTEGGHGTVYHARVAEIPNENDIPKDWAVGCRVIAGPGTVAGAGVVPLPELTDERVVGTLNGKKVYEKTFTAVSGAVGIDTIVAQIPDGTTVDKILCAIGAIYRDTGHYVGLDHNGNVSDNSVKVFLSPEKYIYVCVYETNFADKPLIVTVRYTRTTD